MDNRSLETSAAAALRHIARNEEIKRYIQQRQHLYGPMRKAALRFIGGETLRECMHRAEALNRGGSAVTIDYMGESTQDIQDARDAVAEFRRVAEEIEARGLDASISLDLSHIGLVVDEALTFEHASRIAQAAGEAGAEMMISMEGSERTDVILDMHRRLSERFDNVGITLQAYLFRTDADCATALEPPGRIRLVKGAYEEPPGIAYARGDALDARYRDLMERLLASGHSCSIATHDPRLLEHAHEFIERHEVDRRSVEFEMLHGVTPERLDTMRERGYRVRTYLPYGTEWYLYLCHRLAEYPPNLFGALADAVGVPNVQ